jgi:hypothetical protein
MQSIYRNKQRMDQANSNADDSQPKWHLIRNPGNDTINRYSDFLVQDAVLFLVSHDSP